VLYDVLQDPGYRATWDKFMLESREIGHINPNNNLSYYARKKREVYSIKMGESPANHSSRSLLSFPVEEPRLRGAEQLAGDAQRLPDHQPLCLPQGRARQKGIRQGSLLLDR